MNITILYNTRAGHTKILAENIANIVSIQGHKPTLKSVIEVSKADIDSADMLFIGTWVHGMILFNVRPANAELWVKSLPDLRGKPVATFCTYAFNPRKSLTLLNDLLQQRGAKIVGQQAFQRDRLDANIEGFVTGVIDAIRSDLGLDPIVSF